MGHHLVPNHAQSGGGCTFDICWCCIAVLVRKRNTCVGSSNGAWTFKTPRCWMINGDDHSFEFDTRDVICIYGPKYWFMNSTKKGGVSFKATLPGRIAHTRLKILLFSAHVTSLRSLVECEPMAFFVAKCDDCDHMCKYVTPNKALKSHKRSIANPWHAHRPVKILN